MNNDILNTPIEFLKGVGPNRAKLIKNELKISNFKDLLFQFPYRYVDKTKYHKISEINSNNSEIQLIGEIKALYVQDNLLENFKLFNYNIYMH